ncbi:cilia- and flagella-associated protein 410 [Lethenteron reissneri]|uniref:cilia- and flagella-associated protein 410 n=1 Tax=Lethenteron reissneri TaxID=7753 RepID=UPI002AB6CE22|nr:cilia- and flagella-associated protein 410 [Lethenteron reissneri]
MKTLTKKLVLARARAGDLSSVRKLNCWGSELSDVSIFRQMPNIEVLTLSVNNIDTLKDFKECVGLRELYLRRNAVVSLAELWHLKTLPHLRVLWLADNPCCGTDPHHYRMCVLRNLPGLHKLDNQAVTEEELAQAQKEGEDITSPNPAQVQNELLKSNDHISQSGDGTNESLTEADTDPINFSLIETNKIRQQLGMKLLPIDKFSCSNSSPVKIPSKNANVLSAVLLLVKELDLEGLQIIHKTIECRLQLLQSKLTN